MFTNRIDILVISKEKAIEEAVRKQLPMEDCELTIRTEAAYNGVPSGSPDAVYIVDGSEQTLREMLAKGLHPIAYVAGFSEVRRSMDKIAQQADYLWIVDEKDRYAEEVLCYYAKKQLQQSLNRAEQRKLVLCFDTMIDSLPDLFWVKDITGAHLKVNNGFCRAVEKTKEDIYKKGHYYIWDMPEEEYQKGDFVCLESEEIVMKAGETCFFDEKVKTKYGMRQFKTYKSPLIDVGGEIIGTCGVAHDITELHNIGIELETILSNFPLAVVVEDEAGAVLTMNNEFERSFPEGRSLEKFGAWKKKMLEGSTVISYSRFEECRELRDGERIYIFWETPIINDALEEKIGTVNIFQDVTEEKRLEDEKIRIANMDFLTGLNNRRSLFGHLEQAKDAPQITMITLDLDNFKTVNDVFGHHAGDTALVAASTMLNTCFPQDFIARLGGDEFLIVIERELSDAKIEKETDDFIQKCHSYFRGHEQFDKMTVSAGVTTFRRENGEYDFEKLMNQSDKALYEAKESGKATYRVYGHA